MSNPFRQFNGTTVLHLAIRKSNVEICKFFVEKAPKNIFTKREEWPLDNYHTVYSSPLKLAFSMENFEIIKCLALNSPIEHVDGTLWNALCDYSGSKAPVENKKHLLEKINFVGSLLQDSKLSLKLCACSNFPMTDSDIHEVVQEYMERVRKRVQGLKNV